MMNGEQGGGGGGSGGGASIQRSFRLQDMPAQGIMRERSFVRPQSHHQHFNHPHQLRDGGKRKSMIVTNNRVKPTMEIYRPPSVRVDGVQQQQNKLNVHAKEFTMSKHNDLQTSRSNLNINQMYSAQGIQHSKSSGSILQQLMAQQAAGGPQGQAGRGTPQHPPPLYPHHHAVLPLPLPLLTSASSSNLLHGPPRVHFKLQPQQMNTIPLTPLVHDRKKSPPVNGQAAASNGVALRQRPQPLPSGGLKRSKSLTASDTLASGMAALGLTADATDLGTFPQEIQENLDKAIADPNQLPARVLMELVGHVLRRAVESPRYALPAARTSLAIIDKERSQTYLESLLNACQQWYQDRDKLLNVMIGGGRPRLMAFISLLLELFCQLRRRATTPTTPTPSAAISPPARALLTLICRCCEECIRTPVPSASDTENLFFVLTFIGRDLESQLPGDLEKLLSAVRDAFLNASAAAPSVSRTLLQLIELHASHWQLPGGAVLYYYPSNK